MNIVLLRRSETRAEKSGGGGENEGRLRRVEVVEKMKGGFDRGGGALTEVWSGFCPLKGGEVGWREGE
uniref:Uncharacterized protein n=1 Tax=Oryza meridionalis TaxID=40149 RepID=A0A0E0EXW5_9ORYZ